jgi:hypothetical protein
MGRSSADRIESGGGSLAQGCVPMDLNPVSEERVEPIAYAVLAADFLVGGTALTRRADRWVRRTTIGCEGMLAPIAGTVSYLHMHPAGWIAGPVCGGTMGGWLRISRGG